MSSSLFLVLRILFAWALAVIVAGFVWAGRFGGNGGVFGVLALLTMALALVGVATHVRRVQVLAGRL